MANRFLSNITINDQYTFPSSDGDEGQILSTTGAADGTTELQFIDQSTLNSGSAESVHISVKNTSGDQILKGTPVYVTGETGNSGKIEVAPADASDSAKMPALGLLESTLNHNGEGYCVQGGLLEGLATATIDGTLTTANDTVYVKSGGGLTMTKPTGTGLIQNIAKVSRTHASNGSLVVSSILRTNDVPNLPTGRIWVGDGNTIVSDTVYVDEPNNRVGIGTDNPTALLTLESSSTSPYPGIDIKSTSTYPGGKIRFLDSSGSEVSTIESFSNPVLLYLQLNYGSIASYSSTLTLGGGFLHLSTAGSERMRITSTGNVGIGTTSPTDYKLDVVNTNDGTTGIGSFRVSAQANAGTVAVFENTFGINTSLKISDTVDDMYVVSRNGIMGLGPSGGWSSTNLNIKSNGYVGIGQRNPAAPLHLKRNGEAIRLESVGDSLCSIDFRQGAIKRGHIEYQNSVDTLEIKTTNPSGDLSEIRFSTAIGVGAEAQEVMRIKGGQVVIGNPTSAGGRELYVKGEIEVTGALNKFNGSLSIGGRVDADSYKLKGLNTAPATSTSFGNFGEIRYTADYIYVCVGNNAWKRAALTSW